MTLQSILRPSLLFALCAVAFTSSATGQDIDLGEEMKKGWTCAEVRTSSSLDAKTDAQHAEETIARRMKLQLEQLGKLCPSIEIKRVGGRTEFDSSKSEAYWEAFHKQGLKLHFWTKLFVNAWKQSEGLFDLVVVMETETTSWLKPEVIESSSDPRIIAWSRSYKAGTLGEFASWAVDEVLATFPFEQ